MVNQGITCLPRDIRKYMGSITKINRAHGRVVYEARMRHRGFSRHATFKTEKEAVDYMRKTNIKEGLKIKNRYTVFVDRVTVELPNDMFFTCDIDDIDVVEAHIWCVNSGRYVITQVDGHSHKFHNVIMNHRPGLITVDHIDRNTLNCRKSNLRLVDKSTQNINRSMLRNNTSGTVGVHYEQRGDNWIATWKDEEGNQYSKSYSAKKYGTDNAKVLAIEYRARMVRELPHYANALRLDDKI